jgi:hypothetical protein
MEPLTVRVDTQDRITLARTVIRLPVTIRLPRKTQSVRVVLEMAGSGRVGAVELDRKTIDAAPEAPTPDPKLLSHPPGSP